jgi:hypothetical protein
MPERLSRHLYAGCRQTGTQVSVWLVLGHCRDPSFDIGYNYRHFFDGSFTFVSFVHT